MDAISDVLRTQKELGEASNRTSKPRSTGITMILVLDIANYGPDFVRPFSQLVDKVKILDTMWHDDPATLVNAVKQYRELDIDVAFGGTQFEIATAQGRLDEYVASLKDLGISEVEIEHNADAVGVDAMQDEVDFFKSHGFSIVGEVGKKWAWKDPTRASRDLIHVDETIEAINAYHEAGADLVYWEGAVVGGLIGRQLENTEGQEQLLEVAGNVDLDRLVFEIYDRRNQPLYPMIAWLVQMFGPNVNLANIEPWHVKRVEWIRHGIIFEMDHPYMRWCADPKGAEHWWELKEMPDYSIDVQRPFALEPLQRPAE